jgi:hypothetical protein
MTTSETSVADAHSVARDQVALEHHRLDVSARLRASSPPKRRARYGLNLWIGHSHEGATYLPR